MTLSIEKLLSEASEWQLEEAIRKKRAIKLEETKKAEQERFYERFKNREPCPVVGLGYTAERLAHANLLRMTIKGNASSNYDVDLNVAPGVSTYFGNCIPWSHRTAFVNHLQKQANEWIQSQFTNSPSLVADLMDLSIRDSYGEKVRKQAEKDAVAHLKKTFTKKQLQDTKKGHDLFHGKNLVEKAIKSYGKDE